MKPLPEAVQAAFPCEAGSLRERPWWYKSRHGVSGADCLRRTDDPHTTAPTVEQAAAHDAANPFPHPGFRAGQVWANDKGHSVVVLAVGEGITVTKHGEWYMADLNHTYPYLMADPACPWLAPWSPSEVKP
jgi:hypothetical protein